MVTILDVPIFSSPERSQGRAIVLLLASASTLVVAALAKC